MLTSDPVLGRKSESAVLHRAVAAAQHQGAALLVVGEPGIGKSALLAQAAAFAGESGCTVLRASGIETETHLPFGGVHQLLTPLMGDLTGLPAAHHHALATAFGLVEGANPDLFLIAEAALSLILRECGRASVVVVVDDVHWLDPQSDQIVTFIARRASSAGISVIAATRPEKLGFFGEAGFPQLQVDGVDEETAQQILMSHSEGLAPAELRQVRHEAAGNPLALLELPRSWREGSVLDGRATPLSAKLERAFAHRVSELPAATRDALLIAAIGSSSRPAELLAALFSFGTQDVSPELLLPAMAAGLLTGHQSSVTFRHPLVRSGVLRRETVGRRQAAHAAWADVLDAERYRQVWHRAWSIVGPDDEVAEALTETVTDSLRRGAVMSAVASLERAAQLTSSSAVKGERLLLAALRAFEVGRADVVARLLREAGEVDLSDLDRIRMAWMTETLNEDVRTNSALVRDLLGSASRAASLGDQPLALNILLAAALRCWWSGGTDDCAETIRVLDRLTTARADPRHLAAVAIAEPVLKASEVMAALGREHLGGVGDGDTLRVYGMAAYAVGDLVLATDLFDRAEQAFRRDGRLGMLPVVLALQLHIRLDLGDWSGAGKAAREVVAISQETGQVLFADNNVLVEARAMALRGEWRDALETMKVAEFEAMQMRINDRICFGYHARGAALLSADRPASAFECLARQYDPSDPGYHLRESFAGVALMAEAAVACGRIQDARKITRRLDAVAVLTPSPLLEVNLLYANAVLAPPDARADRYRDLWSYDLTRWPWLRARGTLAYGQWLAQTGRQAEAASNLTAAAQVFAHLGAARWLRIARQSLAQIGRGE